MRSVDSPGGLASGCRARSDSHHNPVPATGLCWTRTSRRD